MNLCKDCKHFDQPNGACLATAISLIDGVSRHSVDYCGKARSRNGRCGLEGRLYEANAVIASVPVEAPKRPRKPRSVEQEGLNE